MEDFVAQAMSDANIDDLDERRLIPLPAARKRVSAAKQFGPWRDSGDNATDLLWAALLSLADGDEFVREATRLKWRASPRGMDNIAPFQRYGASILPWLAAHLDRTKKVLVDDPWCVAPCLACIGTRDAFAVVLAANELESGGEFDDLEQLVTTMVDRFPDVGWPLLAERALAGDSARFKRIVRGRSSTALAAIERALGRDTRGAVEEKFGIAAKLETREILNLFDRAAETEHGWPVFNHDFEATLEYTAMRLVAARDGDRWGVALERLTGGDWDHFSIQRYVFGSEVTPGFQRDEPAPDIRIEGPAEYDAETAVGSTIHGPAGCITLTERDLETLELHPDEGTEPDSGAPQLVLLRAYVARFPGTIWLPDTMDALRLPDVTPMIVTESFAHAVEQPSRSRTYKSLAEAIVANDPAKFVPGKSNTDWRKHLSAS